VEHKTTHADLWRSLSLREFASNQISEFRQNGCGYGKWAFLPYAKYALL
jgi:hypothetical protein